jgi:hypothetical protein
MESGWWILITIAVVAVLLSGSKRNRQENGGSFIWVPGPARSANPLKTLFVLAILGGLGWFFWYVMMTRCQGTC